MMHLATAIATPAPPAPAHPGVLSAPVDALPARLVLFVGVSLRPPPALADALARHGIRRLWLAGPEEAEQAAALARFDAVVLDAATVEAIGAGAFARLRRALGCPLVVVADRADEVDEIVALELGADLFLVRPLSDRRLRAHLSALLRRHDPAEGIAPAAGELRRRWELDARSCRLVSGAHQVALTELQTRLLQCLLRARGRVVAREDLMTALPQGARLGLRSLDVYIHRLRRRLRAAAVQGLEIEVVRGRGWLLGAGAAA